MKKEEEKLFIEALYDQYSYSIKAMLNYNFKSKKIAKRYLFRIFAKIIKYRKQIFSEDSSDVAGFLATLVSCACFSASRKTKKCINFDNIQLEPEFCKSGKESLLPELLLKKNIIWFKNTFLEFGSPFNEICVLKFYYKMKTSEVASVLGMSSSEVSNIMSKYLFKLQTETNHYLKSYISPSELGIAIGMVGKAWADDLVGKLESFSINRISSVSNEKRFVLIFLFFSRHKLRFIFVVLILSIIFLLSITL